MQETTKQELLRLKEVIRETLEHSQLARGNDNHLYFLVCWRIAAANGVDIHSLTFAEAFQGAGCGLPRYESVTRLRRMAQRENPDLLPAVKVSRGRARQEADFREFARMKGEVQYGRAV